MGFMPHTRRFIQTFPPLADSGSGLGGGGGGIAGVDLVDDIVFFDAVVLEAAYPAADNSGRYAVVDNGFGEPIFYKSNGVSWVATGTIVAGSFLFPDWDSILTTDQLYEGDPIRTGASFYRWKKNVVGAGPGAGTPIRNWIYEAGAATRIAYITGAETGDGDLTAQGWDTVDDVSYPGGGIITLDSITNSSSLLIADHTGAAGSLAYLCGYFRLVSFTGGTNSTRIPSLGIGDGSNLRYLNLAEDLATDRLYTNLGDPVIAEDISVSSELVWLEWMLDGDQTVYGYAGHRGQPSVVASGSGLSNSSKGFRIQAGATGSENAIVQCSYASCILVEP